MQLEVEVTHTTKEIIEVEFPIFHGYDDVFDSGGWYQTWTRIEENGTYWSLTLRCGTDSKVEWEFESGQYGKHDIARYAERSRGSVLEKCSAEEFFKALEAMRSDLAHFPGQIPSRSYGDLR